ncbi:MAG: leucine-rich repeat protein [Ruminococcus sp.]|nr:leucine-rich repeat protein [Ruminococcus sp.]
MIGDCAFEYCESLSEITVPGTVTSLGSSVFSGAGDILIKDGKASAAEKYAIKREHRFEAL